MTEKSNHRRNKFKNICKGKTIPELQEMLREKRIEFGKRQAKQMAGSKFKSYSVENKGQPTIKELRREIAVIQTFINQETNKLNLVQKK